MILYTRKDTKLESGEGGKKVAKIKAAFHNTFSPMAHCNLQMTNNNMPQNVTSQAKDMK
jgi:hypothetical protein